MIFEDALAEMRKGKKITNPYFEKDEYLMACRVGIIGDETPIDERPLSIVKLKGDRQHDEMVGVYNYVAKIKRQLKKILTEKDFEKYHNIYTEIEISQIFDNNIFKYPQLNLFLIMRDDWVVLE